MTPLEAGARLLEYPGWALSVRPRRDWEAADDGDGPPGPPRL